MKRITGKGTMTMAHIRSVRRGPKNPAVRVPIWEGHGGLSKCPTKVKALYSSRALS